MGCSHGPITIENKEVKTEAKSEVEQKNEAEKVEDVKEKEEKSEN